MKDFLFCQFYINSEFYADSKFCKDSQNDKSYMTIKQADKKKHKTHHSKLKRNLCVPAILAVISKIPE